MGSAVKVVKILLFSLLAVPLLVFMYHGRQTAELDSNQLVVIQDSGTTLTKPNKVLFTGKNAKTEQLFMKRRSSLQKWCSTKNNVEFIDYQKSKSILHGYDWMYIPIHNLFYCSIPKAGSTTMKNILMKVMGVERNGEELHDQAADVLSMDAVVNKPSPLNIPLAKAKRNPFYPEKQPTHSLIIVRDPWQRLVSSYQNKIKEKGHALQYYCKEYPPAKSRGRRPSFDISFPEFVNCVLSNYQLGLPFFDDHLFPMNKLCGICLINYDMIGKNEDHD